MRAALSMTPAQRLENLSNMWPFARAHQTIAARRRAREAWGPHDD
jgi:hypothetical protein